MSKSKSRPVMPLSGTVLFSNVEQGRLAVPNAPRIPTRPTYGSYGKDARMRGLIVDAAPNAVDPVRVTYVEVKLPNNETDWFSQADCDDCGWHTRAMLPRTLVEQWAALHRKVCLWKVKDG